MTAIRRLLTVAACVLVIGSIAAPAVSAQTGNELSACDDITEGGTYVISGDINQVNGSGAASCIEILTDEDVTIDGDGHSIIGNGSTEGQGNSKGIYTNESGAEVTVHDVGIRGWDVGIDHKSGRVILEDSEIRDNVAGIDIEMATIDVDGVLLENNSVALDHLAASVSANDVEVTGNGAGMNFADGGGIELTNSRFNGNGEYGVEVRHMTSDVQLTNVEINDNEQAGLSLMAGDSSTTVEDSEITGNGGHGIDGTRATNHELELDGVGLEGNDGDELRGYVQSEEGVVASGSDVSLGTGVTADFDEQSVNLDAAAVDWSDTDAVTVGGNETGTDVTLAFEHDGETGQLWKEADDGWKLQSKYRSGGTFQEAVDAGTWTADGSTEQTPTPTPTETATPAETQTSTQTAMQTPTQTESSGGGPSAAASQSGPSIAERPTSTGATETTEQVEVPAATDTPGATGMRTEPAASNPADRGGESESPSSTITDETTDSSDGTDTPESTDEGDGGSIQEVDDSVSSMDGPGFGPLVALLALLASASLIRRR